jgi:hypothetical protein
MVGWIAVYVACARKLLPSRSMRRLDFSKNSTNEVTPSDLSYGATSVSCLSNYTALLFLESKGYCSGKGGNPRIQLGGRGSVPFT